MNTSPPACRYLTAKLSRISVGPMFRKRVVSRDEGSISSGSRSVKTFRGHDATRQKNFFTESSKRSVCPALGSSSGLRW